MSVRLVLPVLTFLFLFGVGFFALTSEPAMAQTGLVPQECVDSPTKCNFCTFITLVKNVVDLLFEILVVIAVIMMVYAGLRLVTSAGDVSAKESAKGMITNVLIGFVIVLSAWLVVDTIVKILAGGDEENWGMWHEFKGDCGGTRNEPMGAPGSDSNAGGGSV